MISLMRAYRFLFLFLVTLLYCLVTALNAQLGLPQVTEFIFVLIFITSILVIGKREEKLLGWLILFGIMVLIHITLKFWVTHRGYHALNAFFAMDFFLLLTISCLKLTLQDKTINITTLFGSLSGYLFVGLTFGYFYLAIHSLFPNSFTTFEPYNEVQAIYFSFVTLTTLGFGDIVANSPVLQTIAWIEAFLGQAYMAMFISLLVGRYVAENISKHYEPRL